MKGILATRLGQKHFNFSSRERSPKQRRVCFDETQRVGGVNIPNHVPHDVDLHKETINQLWNHAANERLRCTDPLPYTNIQDQSIRTGVPALIGQTSHSGIRNGRPLKLGDVWALIGKLVGFDVHTPTSV